MLKENIITLTQLVNKEKHAMFDCPELVLTHENVKGEVRYNDYACDYNTFREHLCMLDIHNADNATKAKAAKAIVELYGRDLVREHQNRYEMLFQESSFDFNLVPVDKDDFVNLLNSGIITSQGTYEAKTFGSKADDELCKYLDEIPVEAINESEALSIDNENDMYVKLSNGESIELAQVSTPLVELLKYDGDAAVFCIVKVSDIAHQSITYKIYALKNLEEILNQDVEEGAEVKELPEKVTGRFYAWAIKYMESGTTADLTQEEIKKCQEYLKSNSVSKDAYDIKHVVGSITESYPRFDGKACKGKKDECVDFTFTLKQEAHRKTATHNVTIYTPKSSKPMEYFNVNNAGIEALKIALPAEEDITTMGRETNSRTILLYCEDAKGDYMFFLNGKPFASADEYDEFLNEHEVIYARARHFRLH